MQTKQLYIPCGRGSHRDGSLVRTRRGCLSKEGSTTQLANSLTRRPGQGGGGPHLRSRPPTPSPSAAIVREHYPGLRTCLVLQLVQPLSSLSDFCDVLSHDADGVVDLLLDSRRLRVARASRVRGGAATGQVGIIRFRPVRRESRCKCNCPNVIVRWVRGERKRVQSA